MAGKELRRLGRAELVDIIYELQKNEARLKASLQENTKVIAALRQENETLQARCETREFRQSQAGSIAEAMAAVSDIFDRSQALADEYLDNVRRLEEQAKQTLSQAQAEADELRRRSTEETEALMAAKWAEFEERMLNTLKAQQGLQSVLDQFQEVADVSQT